MTNQQEKQYDYLLKLVNKQPKSEIQLQSKCAELLYWFYHEDYKRLVCVNNNDRKANTSNIGIVDGASDTYWIAAYGRIIFIEFKFGTNQQSKNQKEWETLISRFGHFYYLCYNEQTFWQMVGFKEPSVDDILKLKWFV